MGRDRCGVWHTQSCTGGAPCSSLAGAAVHAAVRAASQQPLSSACSCANWLCWATSWAVMGVGGSTQACAPAAVQPSFGPPARSRAPPWHWHTSACMPGPPMPGGLTRLQSTSESACSAAVRQSTGPHHAPNCAAQPTCPQLRHALAVKRPSALGVCARHPWACARLLERVQGDHVAVSPLGRCLGRGWGESGTGAQCCARETTGRHCGAVNQCGEAGEWHVHAVLDVGITKVEQHTSLIGWGPC